MLFLPYVFYINYKEKRLTLSPLNIKDTKGFLDLPGKLTKFRGSVFQYTFTNLSFLLFPISCNLLQFSSFLFNLPKYLQVFTSLKSLVFLCGEQEVGAYFKYNLSESCKYSLFKTLSILTNITAIDQHQN